MLLYPTLMLRRITALTPKLLKTLGVSALILDADNTLTTHNNPVPDPDVLHWLNEMRQHGIRMVIASNNSKERIRPFAESLHLAYVSRAAKPLPFGLSRTAKQLGLSPDQVAVVGDQIFTDIVGGNLFGAKTVLVEPMQPEEGPFFRLKRWLEVRVIRRYRKKRGNGVG